jgi:large subunit ribosomal protein L22
MTLKFTNKRATLPIEQVLTSAIANATEKSEGLDVDNLFVERAYINEGPRMKRIRPAPMGRAFRYQRRMSHVTIELGEKG